VGKGFGGVRTRVLTPCRRRPVLGSPGIAVNKLHFSDWTCKACQSRESGGYHTWSKFTDIAFFVLGRFKERYVTPGCDEPAGLRNASASEEAEMLYALPGKRPGDGNLQDRGGIIRNILR
jgi:hypothetical protein